MQETQGRLHEAAELKEMAQRKRKQPSELPQISGAGDGRGRKRGNEKVGAFANARVLMSALTTLFGKIDKDVRVYQLVSLLGSPCPTRSLSLWLEYGTSW